ncbi:MAG: LacI family DNA-binding transcriptional regulator [Lentisphaeria bacterium]|nr:LacI family DNA-binding transcriptional regulator [Lentisphaeria bacterium]
MSGKITVRKLSAELGLAPSTVHRALSGHPNVRTETRREVLRAAQKKGYLLPLHEKRNIAVIVPSFNFSGYLESLLPCLEKEFHQRGFRLQLIPHRDIALLGDHMFDGILSLEWKVGLEKFLPENFAIPVLTLNGASNTLENIPRISSDPHGIRQALEYLHRHGCRRIFYISTVTENSLDAAERLAEFRQFCLKTGQNYEKLHLELHWPEIEANMPLILKAAPDACFCSSEAFSIKVGHLLKAAGKRIPEDISLMGLEDSRGNACFSPPITAIRQNFELMAATAANNMDEMLTTKKCPASCKIPFILIERQSVRKSVR